jgi:hypothetical protein
MDDETDERTNSDERLHLLSKEIEEAANLFLTKLEELEQLLCFIDE